MFNAFNWGIILTYTVILLLLLLFAVWITMYIKYKGLIDWWNIGLKLDTSVDYGTLLNFKSTIWGYNSTILYYLSIFNSAPQSDLTLTQSWFLWSELMPYWTSTDMSTGIRSGCLTPRSLVISIKPYPFTGDGIFDDWYSSQKGIQISINLTFDENDDVVKDDNNQFGVYPATTDFNSWSLLITKWLGRGWSIATDSKDGSSDLNVFVYEPNDNDGETNSLKYWYKSNNGEDPSPDNFLARMGIGPNSPLVIYCINGKYSVNGMEVDTTAFQNLLERTGFAAGGWVAYMKGMGDDTSFDRYKSYIKSIVDVQLAIDMPVCTPRKNAGRGWLAGLASALPMFAFAVGSIATGGTLAMISAAGFLIGGGISGYSAGVSATEDPTCPS